MSLMRRITKNKYLIIVVALIVCSVGYKVIELPKPSIITPKKIWPKTHSYGWMGEKIALPPEPYLPFIPDDFLNVPEDLPTNVNVSIDWTKEMNNIINGGALIIG